MRTAVFELCVEGKVVEELADRVGVVGLELAARPLDAVDERGGSRANHLCDDSLLKKKKGK